MNRINAIALGIVTLLFVVLAGSAFAQDGDITPPERGLQTELEPLAPETDWRVEVGLEEPVEREPRNWPGALAWILANLTRIIFGFIALVVLAVLIILLVQQGGGGGLRLSAEAKAGERDDGAVAVHGAVGDAPALTLDQILKLDDLELALGALLRLVLEAAIALSGSVLRRSATAREALRRLPQDFAHLSAVTALVREAERVRYGGAQIDRARFEELVALVRPLLGQERTA